MTTSSSAEFVAVRSSFRVVFFDRPALVGSKIESGVSDAQFTAFKLWSSWAFREAKNLPASPISEPTDASNSTSGIISNQTAINTTINQPVIAPPILQQDYDVIDFLQVSTAPCQYFYRNNWYLLSSIQQIGKPSYY